MFIHLRTAQSDDLATLIKLMSQLDYELTPESLSHNIEAIRAKGGEVFVAEFNDKVCGCVCAMLDARLAEGTFGEIVSLVVDESVRGLGIGKRLVTHAEKWLSAKAPHMRVRANATRKEAHQFYAQLGYSPNKTQVVFTKKTN